MWLLGLLVSCSSVLLRSEISDVGCKAIDFGQWRIHDIALATSSPSSVSLSDSFSCMAVGVLSHCFATCYRWMFKSLERTDFDMSNLISKRINLIKLLYCPLDFFPSSSFSSSLLVLSLLLFPLAVV